MISKSNHQSWEEGYHAGVITAYNIAIIARSDGEQLNDFIAFLKKAITESKYQYTVVEDREGFLSVKKKVKKSDFFADQ